MAPIVCGGSSFSPFLLFSTLYPFSFCNHLDGEERAGCFALTVFLMSCYSQCSVALPHSAVGWSAMCDCGNV